MSLLFCAKLIFSNNCINIHLVVAFCEFHLLYGLFDAVSSLGFISGSFQLAFVLVYDVDFDIGL
jgi:hypothetical protein